MNETALQPARLWSDVSEVVAVLAVIATFVVVTESIGEVVIDVAA